jgi:hypothetical protein
VFATEYTSYFSSFPDTNCPAPGMPLVIRPSAFTSIESLTLSRAIFTLNTSPVADYALESNQCRGGAIVGCRKAGGTTWMLIMNYHYEWLERRLIHNVIWPLAFCISSLIHT